MGCGGALRPLLPMQLCWTAWRLRNARPTPHHTTSPQDNPSQRTNADRIPASLSNPTESPSTPRPPS